MEFVSLIFNCGKIHFVGEKDVRGFLEMRIGELLYLMNGSRAEQGCIRG